MEFQEGQWQAYRRTSLQAPRCHCCPAHPPFVRSPQGSKTLDWCRSPQGFLDLLQRKPLRMWILLWWNPRMARQPLREPGCCILSTFYQFIVQYFLVVSRATFCGCLLSGRRTERSTKTTLPTRPTSRPRRQLESKICQKVKPKSGSKRTERAGK